ncbi:Mismatch repair endonuclease PMS2 [Hypsizygus marmoreus]|uniref:DNA mismatch repair protein PMS1 n=1 Tax=Hypsizygus marmoreus TaxID=39966 RepID=A0A369JM96_HYPMA|nr:Mismatch repair endonuclease PMS2 [Hypsizygus marmoreus]
MAIKAIDRTSIHRITSGQVVVDLQTAVKELVENSLDAGATNIEVRFKQYGLKSIEVIDNGCGIAEQDHDSIALKHHTSKLSSFADLSTVRTFGFRGEALSSLCALSESLSVTTATEPPMGKALEMEASGKVRKRTNVARQRGTTITLTSLFAPLPVRRKELERNIKREFGKALALLNAYALGPCCTAASGVRLTVTNQVDKGQKTVQLRTSGASSTRTAVSALWGPKALDNLVDLEVAFDVERDRGAVRRVLQSQSALSADADAVPVTVKGLISKFTVGAGRTGTDRQFFYVNGRPCNLPKIQKAFNEVYRSFNATQTPFILADFNIPTESCDINVSPDKRTIFLHSEGNLIAKLKTALEETFAPARSTFDLTQTQRMTQSMLTTAATPVKRKAPTPAQVALLKSKDDSEDSEQDEGEVQLQPRSDAIRSSSPQYPSSQVDLGIDYNSEPPSQGAPAPSKEMEGDASMTGSQMVDRREEEKEAQDKEDNEQQEEDAMQVEPGGDAAIDDSRTIGRIREGWTSVTLDTSRAIWSQAVPGHPEADEPNVQRELQDEDEDKDDEDKFEEEEGPARKKRKSDLGSLIAKASRSDGKNTGKRKTPSASASTGTTRVIAQDRMRSTLAGFARSGSQVAVVKLTEEEEDEDEEEEEGEDEEDQLADQSSDAAIEERQDGTRPSSPIHAPSSESTKTIDLTSEDDGFDEPRIPPIFDVDNPPPSTLRSEKPVSRPEVIRSGSGSSFSSGDIALRFDVMKIAETWRRARHDNVSVGGGTEASGEGGIVPPRVPLAAGVSNTEDDGRAVDALARVIEKADFEKMEVVGQFNLGFIVVRRQKDVVRGEGGEEGEGRQGIMDDLFIVDQHAADEKYNFETLQATTSIKSQKLFRPQPLELTASDELLAVENIDILRQNGFEVEESQSMEGDYGHGEGGARFKLTAQPVSKSTVFDMKDLEELIHLMRDRPTGQMVRCSKARAMFAMRACRKSVMVGMPLNRHQMGLVVQHMGTMDLPWNCPHGRPTMRHLLDVTSVSSYRKRVGKVDWSAFDA